MLENIIQGCKQQNPARQRELFGLFAATMMTVCRRYATNTAEAEDILQEAFLKVFRSIDHFDESKGAFGAWLRRIVVNTAIQHWRKWHKTLPMLPETHFSDSPIKADADLHMDEEQILLFIADLPTGFRVVFNLFAIEGYSHAEIADLLGITESTSRSQLARARKQLQEAILSHHKIEVA